MIIKYDNLLVIYLLRILSYAFNIRYKIINITYY